MKYLRYKALDFANDGFFIRWVKNPDEESEWFWQSFMREHPSSVPEIERARELIRQLDSPVHTLAPDELARMRTQLLMKLTAEKRGDQAYSDFPGRGKAEKWWLKVAASLILASCLALTVRFLLEGSSHASLNVQDIDPASVEERINPSGQKSMLFLADGTKVWLNAASRISYGKDFGQGDSRDVYLDGEAFFDVVHNPDKPFVVHASAIQIKVLGTSFNVRSYAEDKTIETTLVQGKVRIEHPVEAGNRSGNIELKPDQRAVFDKSSKVINVTDVDALLSGSWKEARLVFDEEPMDNVILQMERWFDVTIYAENRGQLDCKLTANIEHESLEDVLKLIEVSHDVKYRISGRNVFIEGSLCK